MGKHFSVSIVFLSVGKNLEIIDAEISLIS